MIGRPPGMTPELIAEREATVTTCLRMGMTNTQIAERYNVTLRTVSRWRTRLGQNGRPAVTKHTQSEHDHALYLLDEGASFADVARTIGVSRRTIYRWFPDREPWTRSQVVEHISMTRAFRKVA